jgi:hypothetical protein
MICIGCNVRGKRMTIIMALHLKCYNSIMSVCSCSFILNVALPDITVSTLTSR